MQVLPKISAASFSIRQIRQSDCARFVEFMINPLATRYLMLSETQKTPRGASELCTSVIEAYSSSNVIHAYCIADDLDRYIGSCGFSAIDAANGVFECFYSLLPEYWGQGIATLVMRSLIAECRKFAEIKELRAYMHPDNPRSAGVAQRLGMQRMGRHSHPLFASKSIMYSLPMLAREPS